MFESYPKPKFNQNIGKQNIEREREYYHKEIENIRLTKREINHQINIVLVDFPTNNLELVEDIKTQRELNLQLRIQSQYTQLLLNHITTYGSNDDELTQRISLAARFDVNSELTKLKDKKNQELKTLKLIFKWVYIDLMVLISMNSGLDQGAKANAVEQLEFYFFCITQDNFNVFLKIIIPSILITSNTNNSLDDTNYFELINYIQEVDLFDLDYYQIIARLRPILNTPLQKITLQKAVIDVLTSQPKTTDLTLEDLKTETFTLEEQKLKLEDYLEQLNILHPVNSSHSDCKEKLTYELNSLYKIEITILDGIKILNQKIQKIQNYEFQSQFNPSSLEDIIRLATPIISKLFQLTNSNVSYKGVDGNNHRMNIIEQGQGFMTIKFSAYNLNQLIIEYSNTGDFQGLIVEHTNSRTEALAYFNFTKVRTSPYKDKDENGNFNEHIRDQRMINEFRKFKNILRDIFGIII